MLFGDFVESFLAVPYFFEWFCGLLSNSLDGSIDLDVEIGHFLDIYKILGDLVGLEREVASLQDSSFVCFLLNDVQLF
jgi:hypothetical protein